MIVVWEPVTDVALLLQQQRCRSVWSQQGDGEFRRGRVWLSGWIQTRRRLPCLSERQWSVHFYLTHWQASTQLSHTFHFRVYELACMQERAHARGKRESENARSFNLDDFMQVTQGLYLHPSFKVWFVWFQIHLMFKILLLHMLTSPWTL